MSFSALSRRRGADGPFWSGWCWSSQMCILRNLKPRSTPHRRGADNILKVLSVHVCVRAGYGLHCHRAVITLCKLIGIKDMYCKVEGSVNLLNITRALFTGLANQVRSCDQIQARSQCLRWFVFGADLVHAVHLAGNPPEAGRQEAAPRGWVPGAPGPAAPGGGESQRRSAAWRRAWGRGPQHAAALGRRSSVAGTQTLHLGGRQTHHLVGSGGANNSLWLDGELRMQLWDLNENVRNRIHPRKTDEPQKQEIHVGAGLVSSEIWPKIVKSNEINYVSVSFTAFDSFIDFIDYIFGLQNCRGDRCWYLGICWLVFVWLIQTSELWSSTSMRSER